MVSKYTQKREPRAKWADNFIALVEYVEAKSHTLVPLSYETTDGFRLGQWLHNERRIYKEYQLFQEDREQQNLPGLEESEVEQLPLKLQSTVRAMPEAKRKMFEALPGWWWEWSPQYWRNALRALRQYERREGHCEVPQSHVESSDEHADVELGAFVAQVQQLHTDGHLPSRLVKELQHRDGWIWTDPHDPHSDDPEGLVNPPLTYEALSNFFEREGHPYVPYNWRERIGPGDRWIVDLDQELRQEREAYQKGSLPPDYVAALEAIPGWKWSQEVADFNVRLNALRSYYRSFGPEDPPLGITDDLGGHLCDWVRNWRAKYWHDSLDQFQAEALQELADWRWADFDHVKWRQVLEIEHRCVWLAERCHEAVRWFGHNRTEEIPDETLKEWFEDFHTVHARFRETLALVKAQKNDAPLPPEEGVERLKDLRGEMESLSATFEEAAVRFYGGDTLERLMEKVRTVSQALHRSQTEAAGATKTDEERDGASRPIFGTYQVTDRIDGGTQSEIWAATDTAGQEVAIKTPVTVATKSPIELHQQATGLAREAAVLMSIKSPHVVSVVTDGTDKFPPWLALEYLYGDTLRHVRDKTTQLDPTTIMEIGKELALAIKAVKDTSVTHGDVNPNNVMLVEDRGAVLIDFGHVAYETMLPPEGLTGTPGFMAPEVVAGQPASSETDVYGWGATLYYAVTGEPPPLPGDLAGYKEMVPFKMDRVVSVSEIVEILNSGDVDLSTEERWCIEGEIANLNTEDDRGAFFDLVETSAKVDGRSTVPPLPVVLTAQRKQQQIDAIGVPEEAREFLRIQTRDLEDGNQVVLIGALSLTDQGALGFVMDGFGLNPPYGPLPSPIWFSKYRISDELAGLGTLVEMALFADPKQRLPIEEILRRLKLGGGPPEPW